MKCSRSGCTRNAEKQCVECNGQFCSDHYEICDFCEAPVCHDCREVHLSNPLHEEQREA